MNFYFWGRYQILIMSPSLLIFCVILYSLMLFGITYLTTRKTDNASYFVGNRSSRWYVVAYGMIGASLSGVTFLSVPGDVGKGSFAYFQMILGYMLGYAFIALVLLPLYYRLNLTSIYTFLRQRFGMYAYRTGAFFFILSRVIGASFRLYVVVNVLQLFVFDAWHIPFWVTTLAFILLILAYTFQGGVKTIVWTDSLQTTFMLLSLVLSVILICKELHLDAAGLIHTIKQSPMSDIFVWDWHSRNFFPKQFFGGMFIAIAMTGLDQEMMQKNISCKNARESKKNMLSFSVVLLIVNFVFLCLGILLYQYVQAKGLSIPQRTSDDLFPTIALHYLGTFSALFFIIGLISAAYPSADGALTALTASFCIDFLGFEQQTHWSEERKTKIRMWVHFSFAGLLLAVIVVFRFINNESVVKQLFKVATYTYGPLLGLFMFGIGSKRAITDRWAPLVCLLAPICCYIVEVNSQNWLGGYVLGNELLILNGLFTIIGLWFISRNATSSGSPSSHRV
ncbi:MAG TPA: sodium:solute symporter [Bacteroidia bacterium]|jgi:Na+/proline symporter|nr:sodium:solute symporter [Bacteroidia bacterium]